MEKRKRYIVAIVVLAIVVIVQFILGNIGLFLQHEVSTKENAVIIARAAMLRWYGEEEAEKYIYAAFKSEDQKTWIVMTFREKELVLDDWSPTFYVRCSNGNVRLANLFGGLDLDVNFWLPQVAEELDRLVPGNDEQHQE